MHVLFAQETKLAEPQKIVWQSDIKASHWFVLRGPEVWTNVSLDKNEGFKYVFLESPIEGQNTTFQTTRRLESSVLLIETRTCQLHSDLI